MKTYILESERGECVGFEIDNNFLGSGSISRFIKRVKGCEVKSVRKMFTSSEVHTTFLYEGEEFVVWEPYGDNSRLHIGSENKVSAILIKNLKKEVELTRNYYI